MIVALYPGSFDPVTKGHENIVKRSSKLVDKLIVAVLVNPGKKCLFTTKERVEHLKMVFADIENVEIMTFGGLLMDYVAKNEINFIIKGIRNSTDFESEFQMAMSIRLLKKEVETLLIPCDTKYVSISSSIVRQIAYFKGDLEPLVPTKMVKIIEDKYKTSEGEKWKA